MSLGLCPGTSPDPAPLLCPSGDVWKHVPLRDPDSSVSTGSAGQTLLNRLLSPSPPGRAVPLPGDTTGLQRGHHPPELPNPSLLPALLMALRATDSGAGSSDLGKQELRRYHLTDCRSGVPLEAGARTQGTFSHPFVPHDPSAHAGIASFAHPAPSLSLLPLPPTQ